MPAFDRVVAAARQLHLEPIEIAEAVLVTHLDEEDEAGEDEGDQTPFHLSAYPVMPVQTAYEAGLIDGGELGEAARQAAAATSARIQAILTRAKWDRLPTDEFRRLHEARLDPPAFARVAHDLYLRFWITKPMWRWEVRSLPAILTLPGSPKQLELRAREWFRHVRLALERDMHQAWKQAMWHVIKARDEDYTI